jgi:5-methyltetrahydrofolate--homocysteine methyltransferase
LRESDEETVRTFEGFGVQALGVNCQSGVSAAVRLLERLRPLTGFPLWVKPSAGPPDGPIEGPELFAAAVPRLLALGVRFVGGCCGTTEAHVAALRAACYDPTGQGLHSAS